MTSPAINGLIEALKLENIPFELEVGQEGRTNVNVPMFNACFGMWGETLCSCPIVGNPWDIARWDNYSYSHLELGKMVIRKLRKYQEQS